ncbi:hypothetical protein QQX98_003397 [Neonectria punicea]|uniref:phospholipase A2 n=1 Tax=Neonectria punicea TaxID=979145 RepID=A0ABR1HDK7_9HYPO
MLGRLRMPIDECISKYLELSAAAFSPKRFKLDVLSKGKDLWRAAGKYRSDFLAEEFMKAVRLVEGDENALFFDPKGICRVFVCAQSKARNAPVNIRSYTTDVAVDGLSTKQCKIWEAARATSAASNFFDPIQIGWQEFVDGATGHNNPVEEAWKEGNSIWPNAKARIQCLVSIGTGVSEPKDFGNNLLGIKSALIASNTETENTEQRFYENHEALGVRGRYFRFNVDKGLRSIGLDEYEKLDAIMAATESYLNNPRVRKTVERFTDAVTLSSCYAFFYFSPLTKESDKMDLRSFKICLIVQIFKSLIIKRPDLDEGYAVPKRFQELYQTYNPSKEPSSEHIDELFWSLLPLARQTYIVIDALDECSPSQLRDSVLELLGSIPLSAGSNTHILLTSRRDLDIESAVKELSIPKHMVPFGIGEVNDDIQHHLERVISRSPCKEWSSDIKTMVIQHLVSRFDGVFRWADLQIHALARQKRGKDVRRALQKLPQGLEETYERMLKQIDEKDKFEEANAILQWLAYSGRSMTLPALAELAAFQIDDPDEPPDSDAFSISFQPGDRFSDVNSILNMLLGLIVSSKAEDSPVTIVSFAHYTVLEYLKSPRVYPKRFQLDIGRAEWFMFKSAISYINHYDTTVDSKSLPYPFLGYACTEVWRKAEAILSREPSSSDQILHHLTPSSNPSPRANREAFILALRISPTTSSSPSFQNALNDYLENVKDEGPFVPPGFFLSVDTQISVKMAAAAAESTLLKLVLDIGTALRKIKATTISRMSQKKLKTMQRSLSVLSKPGGNVNAVDKHQRIPLHSAAALGHVDLVTVLAQLDKTGTDYPDITKRTPLSFAAEHGHVEVVKLLLKLPYVEIEYPNEEKRTPLSWAAANGHE